MIHVVVGDLTSVAADAVVRPATTWLAPYAPALQRLDDAAGPRFQEQCRLRHELAVGAAVVTGAGALPCEFVVHAIIAEPDVPATADAVRRATAATMWQCTQWQIATLAAPAPPEGTLAEWAAVLQAHMRNADHPANVVVVVPTSLEADTLHARLGQGGS